jgi:hypothetical protein
MAMAYGYEGYGTEDSDRTWNTMDLCEMSHHKRENHDPDAPSSIDAEETETIFLPGERLPSAR